jgi:hypothetical protein
MFHCSKIEAPWNGFYGNLEVRGKGLNAVEQVDTAVSRMTAIRKVLVSSHDRVIGCPGFSLCPCVLANILPCNFKCVNDAVSF